ncbi:MAG: ankyrin repeat domain-containing protein [Candidatus Latescibacteria bacterium]|jgi:ankyrin repeat protein|nr:ankyrin repeat domain-containing protein [Candidatus Latescibacterota bacterium]
MTRFTVTAALALLPATLFAGGTDDLLDAARQNDLALVQALLQGTDVEATTDRGLTALHLAAGYGYTDLTRELIAHGAGVNTQDDLGRTPLMLAAQEGHTDVAHLLLDSGTSAGLRNQAGATALSLAQGYGHRDIVEALKTVPAPTTTPASWRWVIAGAITLLTFLALRHVDENAPQTAYRLALTRAA